uniref:Dynein heavy chain C-terminal domain-containing protein n=1 Tax=Cryptomonas curvata TaxID=233186 RepID=A0A7S0MCH4_9CRYP
MAIRDVLNDVVPREWVDRSYPSLKSLSLWVLDLVQRVQQLQAWTQDFSLLRVTWLPGLFAPRAFLAAIMQSAARINNWKLEDVSIMVEVTKKEPEDVTIAARDGAYIHGFFLEGARWDRRTKSLEEVRGRLAISLMPVILIKAVQRLDYEGQELYLCPVYRTQRRQAAELIFFAHLPSMRFPASQWTLAGVAMTAEAIDDEIFAERKI